MDALAPPPISNMASCQGDSWSFGSLFFGFSLFWGPLQENVSCSHLEHTGRVSFSVTTTTVMLLEKWRAGGSYLLAEVGVLDDAGIHQTAAQLCSSGLLGDLWRLLVVCDHQSRPEQQGRNSELRDNNRRLSATSGFLLTDTAAPTFL